DNWFVYSTDDGARWAVKIPPLLGNNPALGFEPLRDATLPELPLKTGPARGGRRAGRVRMRSITFGIPGQKGKSMRICVGTREAHTALLQKRQLLLTRSDGSEVLVTHTGSAEGESRF